MDSYLKKDTYSHQRAASTRDFIKREFHLNYCPIYTDLLICPNSKYVGRISHFTSNILLYKTIGIRLMLPRCAYFFSLQNLTQTKTHQFVLIMAISSKVFQNMKKSQERHLSSNIGRAQYIS